jgi:hypothetical protein
MGNRGDDQVAGEGHAEHGAAHGGERISSANPQVPAGMTLKESVDYIRFVNPGDLRASKASCYSCHANMVDNVERSMMAHGGMLWGAALYNNGAHNQKNPIFGEHYGPDGQAATLQPLKEEGPITYELRQKEGTLHKLFPLARWEVTQPGNILRVFERGGRVSPLLALPQPNVGAPALPANILGETTPGRPDNKLSVRGLGTNLRTDPVFIGLQKTRLLDPTLNMFGTNDHPGDYRGSGCTACHVVYANDRSPVHAGVWAQKGNRGTSSTADPSIPKDESGHPISHRFVKNVPTSNCMTCHMHPGTLVLNSYLGFTWWDNETHAELMYPSKQQNPTQEQRFHVSDHNPEESAARGLWGGLYPDQTNHKGMVAGKDFLENVSQRMNPLMNRTQFADFHGHGWIFRAVFKQDRGGHLLDAKGNPIDPAKVTPEALAQGVAFQDPAAHSATADGIPVHLKDIHLQRGMHCVDCHFQFDTHSNGRLYGETRNATAINCVDCHGSATQTAKLQQYLGAVPGRLTLPRGTTEAQAIEQMYSGNEAARPTPESVATLKDVTRDHFKKQGQNLIQTAQIARKPDGKKVEWVVPQITPDATNLNAAQWNANDEATKRKRSGLYAHTIRRDNKTWGTVPAADASADQHLAHDPDRMSCYACHTSWNTSCFGCHLPQRANAKKPMLHNEGQDLRNYTNYNFQTLRDDVYMLGVDGSVKGNQIVPIRSACAVMVSSQNQNREWIYTQQQTVSAEGYAGTAFTPYFPHTVRTTETKQCTDCHLSDKNDNNAIMAQLLLQGTNSVNFIGRFAWVAGGKGGVEAVAVTEREEPQAVIGSRLHQYAYPDWYKQHEGRGRELVESHAHTRYEVLDVQQRGEYLYAACGSDGFVAFDIEHLDNKAFSERIITSPVSPLGQQFYVKTKYATSITSPSTLAIDPTRPRLTVANVIDPTTGKPMQPNDEGRITEIGKPDKVIDPSRPIHLMYAFLYLTDKYEGLVVIGNTGEAAKKYKPGVATLLDGDPDNNFLGRAATFNPNGILNGARHMTIHGTLAYIAADRGIVIVDLDNPVEPKVVGVIEGGVNQPRRLTTQFRYLFAVDAEGLKTFDITDPRRPVAKANLSIADARDVYVSRTYAYVAAGAEGLKIVNVTNPEKPGLDAAGNPDIVTYNADGTMNDTCNVKVGMTVNSMYAYVADGKNGLKVLQLTSWQDTPTFLGFSPKPEPRLVATKKTVGRALVIGEGLDRDRAVDEAGNQLAVFGRRGSRPFTLEEQQRLYLHNGGLYTVSDEPKNAPLARPATTRPATPGTPPRTPAATPATRPAATPAATPARPAATTPAATPARPAATPPPATRPADMDK